MNLISSRALFCDTLYLNPEFYLISLDLLLMWRGYQAAGLLPIPIDFDNTGNTADYSGRLAADDGG